MGKPPEERLARSVSLPMSVSGVTVSGMAHPGIAEARLGDDLITFLRSSWKVYVTNGIGRDASES